MYADTNGNVFAETVAKPFILKSIDGTYTQNEYLATDPGQGITVIQDDFLTNYHLFNDTAKARLFVEANAQGFLHNALYARNINTLNSTGHILVGIRGECSGVRGDAGHPNQRNYGGTFIGEGVIGGNNATNIGLLGHGEGPIGLDNSVTQGGNFIATNGFNVCGVYGKAVGGSKTNYGVYGEAVIVPSECTNGNCTKAAGYFAGDVYSTGNYWASDAFLKKNIQPLNNASSILNQLSPKTFTFRRQQFPSMQLNSGAQFGLLADDVQLVLPSLIKLFTQPAVVDEAGTIINDEVDFQAINYPELIPIIIAGFKEQQTRIDSLVTALASCCANPINNGGTDQNKHSIELTSDEAILYQNQPNPFDNGTIIRYFIPQNTGEVKIVFMDEAGRSINEIKVNEKGQGSLEVNSSQLNSGTYSYSLLIDNRVIDTKKMVKTK